MDSHYKRQAAKDYLLQVKYMAERIEEKQRHVEHLQQRLLYPSFNYDGARVKGSKRHDSFEDKTIAYVDKQMQLDELKLKYEIKRFDALVKVLELNSEDSLHIQLLYNVYFKFMTVQDAAKAMNLSRGYVEHLHPDALIQFYDQYLSEPEGNAGDPGQVRQ